MRDLRFPVCRLDDRTAPVLPLQKFGGNASMAEGERKNWRELAKAAREAKDPDELLKILQDLNKALKREEQVRRVFREAMGV